MQDGEADRATHPRQYFQEKVRKGQDSLLNVLLSSSHNTSQHTSRTHSQANHTHLIFPMAVAAPVPTTTPRTRPAVTTVPLNSVLVLSCGKEAAGG
jgi:hypothetical protein